MSLGHTQTLTCMYEMQWKWAKKLWRSVMSNSCDAPGTVAARLLCPWDFPGKNIGVGCHFLFQGIFPTQRSNLCLLHLPVGSLPLGHLRSLNQVFNLSQSGMGVLLFLHQAWSLAVIYRQGAVRMPHNQDPHSWRILCTEVLKSLRTDRQHRSLAFSKTAPGHRWARGGKWVGETSMCSVAPSCLSDSSRTHGL